MGFYSRKNPKTGLLKRGEVVFMGGAVYGRIQYLFEQIVLYEGNQVYFNFIGRTHTIFTGKT